MDECDRDESGKLTRWKTGRRFVYIEVPTNPLPKTMDIGIFRASIYHKEQKIPICNNCFGKNHHSSVCDKPVKCRQCYQDGHKAGDAVCSLLPPPPPAPPSKEGKTPQLIQALIHPTPPSHIKKNIHSNTRKARPRSSSAPKRQMSDSHTPSPTSTQREPSSKAPRVSTTPENVQHHKDQEQKEMDSAPPE